MHMATGVGTPVVALFGPTVRQFGFFPYRAARERRRARASMPALQRHGSAACPLGHHHCMREIVARLVFTTL